MSEQNIVILGGSWAGLGTAHYFLKHTLPTLNGKYKVYLISPSSHFFHRVAGPRAIIGKNALPYDKYYVPIAEGFTQYPAGSFTLIEASATGVDTAARTVTYNLTKNPSQSDTIIYHALVIATGWTSPTQAWNNNSVTEFEANLSDLQTRIPKAKTVIIGGGGPAGVETAGEIGELLNGAAGWFKSRPANPKAKVTLYQADSKLLPVLRPQLAKQAEKLLNRVGVDVVYNTKIVSANTNADGTTSVTLTTGESITADIYIPATGTIPNTGFLPKELLNDKGKVQTHAKTLRVEGAGPRVYAVGDVGSHTRGGIMAIYDAVPVLGANLDYDLKAAAASDKQGTTPGAEKEYSDNVTETQFVPVGKDKGVAAALGWKVPSILVWLVKGRDYMIWGVPSVYKGGKW